MLNSTFCSSGIRRVNLNMTSTAIDQLKSNWKNYVASIGDYPENEYLGKGIVISAGGLSYFTCAWILITQLRKIGCQLPIEIWYQGDELSAESIRQIEKMKVTCRDFSELGQINLKGVMLKPLAIIASRFEEILFLDADNNCLKDPGYLFDSSIYKEKGAIFWPDYWYTDEQNPIWSIVESDDYYSPEQESGQILIHKKKCWKELQLSLYFNINNEIYYRMLYGDKDTFKFAWHALKTSFHMIEKDAGSCGYKDTDGNFLGTTMVQYGLYEEVLFLHRNLLKWDATHSNELVWKFTKDFRFGGMSRKIELNYHSNGHNSINLIGDTLEQVNAEILNLERECHTVLEKLRKKSFYGKFAIYSHLRKNRRK